MGRLIGLKTWDRIDGIFFRELLIGCDCPELVGCLGWNFALKCML